MQNFTSVTFGHSALKFYNKLLVVKMAPQVRCFRGAKSIIKNPTHNALLFCKHELRGEDSQRRSSVVENECLMEVLSDFYSFLTSMDDLFKTLVFH